MNVLFDDSVHVHYGQVYVTSGDTWDLPLPRNAFRGQLNGLCGAADAGRLFLVTGLHTGDVGFRVELWDGEPTLDERWEEVVEVSFTPSGAGVALTQWAGERSFSLNLPKADYRVRYCARGMQAGRDADTLLEGPPLDVYCLAFWAAAPAPDRIVRQTSAVAEYWHSARAKGDW